MLRLRPLPRGRARARSARARRVFVLAPLHTHSAQALWTETRDPATGAKRWTNNVDGSVTTTDPAIALSKARYEREKAREVRPLPRVMQQLLLLLHEKMHFCLVWCLVRCCLPATAPNCVVTPACGRRGVFTAGSRD